MGASNLFLMRLALIITRKIYIIGLPINILICHLMVFVIIFKLRIFCKIAHLDNNCIIMSNFKHQFTQITCKQNYTKVFRSKEFLLFVLYIQQHANFVGSSAKFIDKMFSGFDLTGHDSRFTMRF